MIDHLLSHLHDDTASPEEHEISALASHADTVNTYRIERRREGLPTLYWNSSIFQWCQEADQARVYTETERAWLLPPGGIWVLLQTSTLECHGCGETRVLNRSAREVAEKGYAEGWMVYQGNVLCGKCQER